MRRLLQVDEADLPDKEGYPSQPLSTPPENYRLSNITENLVGWPSPHVLVLVIKLWYCIGFCKELLTMLKFFAFDTCCSSILWVCVYRVVLYNFHICPVLSSFSFSWCTFFAIITSSFSQFQVSIILWGKLYFFVSFKQITFCNFFLCSIKYLTSPFLLSIKSFLSVSSRLFINLYIVIKSPLSLSFSVVKCISFNLSLYVKSSKSSTILVAILCILSNFNICYFLCRNHFLYSSFDLTILVMIFLITSSIY